MSTAFGVFAVSLVFAGVSWGAAYDPAADGFSMPNLTAHIGAQSWWNAGYTGRGVDVAVIDTGVAPVQGLDSPGKVVYGPDLSLESQSSKLHNLDTNGHGTFMAGLIAGHDSTLTAPYSSAPASAYRGVAPDARIVSLKVADADGGTDVTQVIAAIDWVVQHAHDPGFNIRVINLSYGTLATQGYGTDPLAYAVEQAWEHGIVVVAAAGNSGHTGNKGAGLSDPAYDPYVLAVGAYNTMGTSSTADDVVASYTAASTGCSGCRNPDVLAPGSHFEGLRVPGGYLDQKHPEGAIGSRYFRGSGTSESAAVTSGVVALLLQKYPDLSPDEVKALLTGTARPIGGADARVEGNGAIDLPALAAQADPNGSGPFCTGTFGGTVGSLEVTTGATCVLTSTAKVNGTLTVDPGGTLIDQGASIGYDVQASSPATVVIAGGKVGHDVQIQGATGPVGVVGASIGHNLVLQTDKGGVLAQRNSVGHDLVVQGNPGVVVVSGNNQAGASKVANNGGPAGPPVPAMAGGIDAQSFPLSTGLGTIEASRGGDHMSQNGVALSGNQDIFGRSVNTATLAAAEATGSSWSGGNWNGSSWSGSSWSGSSWSGVTWSGSSWSGSSWSGSSWSSNVWTGSSWSGVTWSGSSWSGNSWSGAVWTTVGWN